MKLSKIRMIIAAAVLLISQHGLAATENNQSTPMKVDSWYTLGRALPGTNLEAGTEISVVQVSRDGTQVQIGVDPDSAADATLIWVPITSLEQANAQIVDVDALEAFADLGIDLVTVRRRRSGGGGMTYCLRDVRIRAAHFTSCVPQGIPMASIAYPRYKAAGWQPVEYSANVPNGTACFYGGGRSCGGGAYCGHAAIKLGPNRWVGAGTWPSPKLRDRTDSGRVPYDLHGCLTPPPTGSCRK